MLTRRDFPDGSMIWHDQDNTVVMRRSSTNHWYYGGWMYTFDTWLELADILDEEKVWLRLHYG